MATIKVNGMTCQHCVKSVTEALEQLGARRIEIDLKSGNVNYEEPSPIEKEAIKKAITRIGFEYAE